MKKLLLVDGNSMLFRAYYATAYAHPMSSKDGLPTNAVFTFAMMLQKVIDMIEPQAIMVAFDAGKHTFRHDLYKEYKGGRKQTPDDLIPQFKLTRDYLDAFNIPWLEMENIEADDLIGSIAKKVKDTNVIILSSDHDLLQLIDQNVSVMLMQKGISEMQEVTEEYLWQTMSLKPKQIIDLKALMGDKSDNIPGIPGIGKIMASKLLQEYPSVEEVLAHANELKGALQKKILVGKESALLSKILATIKTDVSLSDDIQTLKFKPTYCKLITFLKKLNMDTLVKKYESLAEKTIVENESVAMKIVEQIPASFFAQDLWLMLDENQKTFFDTEVYGLALASKEECMYISLQDYLKNEKYLSYWNDSKYRRSAYDYKRINHLLDKYHQYLKFSDDDMVMISLADSSITDLKKLKAAISWPEPPFVKKIYQKEKFVQSEHALYCSSFLANLINADDIYYPLISKYGLQKLYYEIEMPLVEILYHMEKGGVICDAKVLDDIAHTTKLKMMQIEKEIYQLSSHPFNLRSPLQLAQVLYDELHILSGKKRTTAANALEKVRLLYPIVDKILEYRKYSKLYSTYAEGLQKYIACDGKIHTIYNQAATQTGRLSSSNPNLQNIAIRDEDSRLIRKAFLADEGCVFISSDYHQIELRILAHMAKVPNLIKAFKNNIDVHKQTAMDLFNVSLEEVTDMQRRQAKIVNFGIIYGMSCFGLAKELNLSTFEANEIIKRYYTIYPEIKDYMQKVIIFCKENGYVETLCHRRRFIPEINSKNGRIKEFGERAAMNAPIQGTAADLIKLAMLKIQARMAKESVKSKMILQVHDELIFNVPKGEIDLMSKIIQEEMSQAMTLNVPLTSQIAIGKTWYEAK